MKALVVVDVQKDFVTGSLGSVEAKKALPKIKKKVNQYLSQRDLIIFTMDIHNKDIYLQTQEGRNLPILHTIEGTKGASLAINIESFDNFENVLTIRKSAFVAKDLLSVKKLYEVESIEVIGICTDICVISNALLLKGCFPEVPIIVDAACCSGLTPELHEKALDVMQSCQIEVVNR